MGELTKNKKITPKLRYFFVWLPPLQFKVFCFCFSFTSISSFFLLLKYGGANKKKDLYKNLTYLFITTTLFDYNLFVVKTYKTFFPYKPISNLL